MGDSPSPNPRNQSGRHLSMKTSFNVAPVHGELASKVVRNRIMSKTPVARDASFKRKQLFNNIKTVGSQAKFDTFEEKDEDDVPATGKGLVSQSQLHMENENILKEYIQIHPISLRYSNAKLEDEFYAHHMSHAKYPMRNLFVAIVLLNIILIVTNAKYAGDSVSHQVSIAANCVLAVVATFVVLFPGSVVRNRSVHYGMMIFTITMAILQRLASGPRSLPERFSLTAGEGDLGFMFLVTLGISMIGGATFELSTRLAVLYTVFVIATIWANPESIPNPKLGSAVEECVVSSTLDKLEISLYVVLYAIVFLVIIRIIELQERKDFRLTQRLAAENIHVNMEVITQHLFSRGVAEVVPEDSSNGGSLKAQIDLSEIEEIDLVGGGTFAEVKRVRWKGMEVAMKKIRGTLSEELMVHFGREAASMAALRHPNVVMFLGYRIFPAMLLMEYMPRHSLYKVIHEQNTPLDFSLRFRMLLDAARGLNFLHLCSPPLIHLDFKSLNVLVDSDWRCKVCDFGLTVLKAKDAVERQREVRDKLLVDDTSNTTVTDIPVSATSIGTLPWTAPELLNGELTPATATEKCDVYSFAVLMFELLTLLKPYDKIDREAIYLSVVKGARPSDNMDLADVSQLKPSVLCGFEALMRSCWDSDPLKRPTVSTVIDELESVAASYFDDKDKARWNDMIIYPTQIIKEKSSPSLQFTVDIAHLDIGKKIGGGSYGDVFQAKYFGTKVAVKQLFATSVPEAVIIEFEKECSLMLRMRHPNLVLFMGSYAKPPKLLLVTELLVKGSLHQLYKRSKRLSERDHHAVAFGLANDMARGLNYLHCHSPPIIHRDLKSPNVLLDANWNAKIGDFGLSKIKEEGKAMTSVGSPLWCAPEILRGDEFGLMCDVYSYGVVLWETLAWQEPYPNMSSVNVMQGVAFKNLRPKLETGFPPLLVEIMEWCWKDNPKERPTFHDILDKLDKHYDEQKKTRKKQK